jgi:hypothetical protein
MSEDEFDCIDELYFVQHFTDLKESLGWDEDRLLVTLQELYQKEFVKCLKAPDEEVFGQIELNPIGKAYYYLATKKGLMNHNSI